MGFVRSRPSADMPHVHPLPGTEAPFGPTLPRRVTFRLCGFSPTMTVYSTHEVAGLLHPAASQEFAAFRSPHRLHRPPEGGGCGSTWRVPRNAVHTLRRLPLVESRTASLRPLPSYPYHHRRSGDSPPDASDAPIRRSGPPRHGAQAHAQAKPTSRPVSLAAPLTPPTCHPKVKAGAPLGRSLRAARPAAHHPQASGYQGSSSVKQSSRLQGLAPSTSPLCRTTVASETTLVPSMGFVSPSRSNVLRSDPTVPGRRGTADAEPKPDGSGPSCPPGDRGEPQSPGEQPGSLCKLPPATRPKPSRETPPVGRNQAPLPRLFSVGRDPRWRALAPTLAEASSSPGQCPQSLSETRSREV
jgi:hypothetical protein